MFLSGSFLGISSFQFTSGNLPLRRSYSRIKIYGNATIDKLQIRNYEMDNTSIKNIALSDNLVWDSNTILACEFENNLKGGNILNLGTDPVTQWQVEREEVGSSSTLKVLDTLDVSQTEYIDYTIQSNKTYKYNIFPLTSNQIGEALVSDNVDTSGVYGFFLTGNDSDGTTYVYKLDLEIKSDNITNEEDFHEYESYTKYNSFAKGQRSFRRTTIQALAGDISISTGELLQSPEYIDALRNRIQDISTKYFKTRKGEIIKCKTHAYSETQLNDALGQQYYLIKFEVIECADI